MITISRDVDKVKIKIELNNGWHIIPSVSCEDGLYALLLRDKLSEVLSNKIESIRREAYEQGYKDKAAKRARKKHFNGNINSDTVGWE